MAPKMHNAVAAKTGDVGAACTLLRENAHILMRGQPSMRQICKNAYRILGRYTQFVRHMKSKSKTSCCLEMGLCERDAMEAVE